MHSRLFSLTAFLALLWLCLWPQGGDAQQSDERVAPYWKNIGVDVANLRDQADRGDATAEYQLGKLYMTGKGASSNYAEAARYLRAAAEHGMADAEVALGYLYEQGKGLPRDYRRAAGYYAAAARQGSFTAANNLATMYEHGQGVRRDVLSSAKIVSAGRRGWKCCRAM